MQHFLSLLARKNIRYLCYGFFACLFFSSAAFSQTKLPEPTEEQISFTATVNSITISWTDVPADVDDYKITITDLTNPAQEKVVATQGTTNTLFTNLTSATFYSITVTAQSDSAQHTDSDPLRQFVTTRIPTPTFNVTATMDTITVSNITIGELPTLLGTTQNSFVITVYLGDEEQGTATLGLNVTSTTLEGFLEPGTIYTVEVVAEARQSGDVLTDSAAGTTIVTTIATQILQLSTPNVTATEITNSITVTWEEVTNAVSYEVLLYEGSDTYGSQVGMTQTVNGLSHTFTDLSSRTTYTVAVVAIGNPVLNTDSAAGTATITTAEQLPQLATPNITLTPPVVDARSVTVFWDQVVANAVRYDLTLYIGNSVVPTNLHQGPNPADVNNLSYSFGGLEPNTQYTIAAVAIAANPATHRNSEPGTVTFTTPQLPQIATPPIFSATATTDTITVSWGDVEAVANYRVSIYAGSVINPANQIGMRLYIFDRQNNTFTGLSPNTEYTVAVIAEGDEFTHRNSNPAVATITTDPPPQLAAPMNVEATATTNSITATWDEVANASSYEVSLYEGDAIDTTPTQTINVGDESTALFANLMPAQYTVAVVAIGDPAMHSDSDPSTATATIERQKLPTPTAEQITFSRTTESITVSWTDVPAEVSTYSITITDQAGFSTQESVAVNDATNMLFGDLTPARFYQITVVAQGNPAQYIDSDPYESSYATRIRTPEYDVEATTDTVTVSNLDIGDTALSIFGNSEIIRYVTTIYLGNQVQSTATAGRNDSATLTGLVPGTEYAVSVVAEALIGETVVVDSDPGTVTVTTVSLPQLATPTSVEATATTNSITATWEAVADAMNYTISLYAGGDTSGNQVDTQTIAAADEHTASFTNLTQGTEYTVAVVAIGDPTMHADSAAGTATTRTVEDRTKLATPTAEQITFSATTNSITASWMDVPEEVSTYSITVVSLIDGPAGFNREYSGAVQGATNTLLDRLTPTVVYALEIVAQGDSAQYIDSDPYEVNVATRIATPVFEVTTTADTLTVSNINIGEDVEALTFGVDEVIFNVTAYLGEQVHSTATAGLDESATFTGLASGTTYTVSVVAVALLDGEVFTDSDPGTATVAIEMPLPPLDTPSILSVVLADDTIAENQPVNALTITWDSVANADRLCCFSICR